MNLRREPMIIIVSAPSGSGKTTIVSDIVEKIEGLKRSVSYTTRPPREGETKNKDYIFISEKEFKKKLEDNKFLEWEKVFGNYYGTSEEQVRKTLAEGKDVILSIDVKGAKTIKDKFPECVSVFIMPPSVEELAVRLKKRDTDSSEEAFVRLAEAGREIKEADEYDYMIVNEDLEKAQEEMTVIIEKERKNRTKSGDGGKQCKN